MSLSSPPHVNILIIRNPNMQTQDHIAGGEPDHICDKSANRAGRLEHYGR